MDLTPRPARLSSVIMTELVLPVHTNSLNSVFGGVIMSWIDIAAAIAAQRHSSLPVVTASIDTLNFVAPVYIGWVVNLQASVNYVGQTSMEVGVRCEAENPLDSRKCHTASAYLTFVALGSNGRPTKIRPVIAETEAEKRRYSQAQTRRENRLKLRLSLKSDASS